MKIYQDLVNTSSKNEKVALLKTCNEQEKEFFRITYDPYIMTNLKSPKCSTTGVKTFEDALPMFFQLYEKLRSREITGNVARDEVTAFLNDCDATAQDLFKKAIQKDLKCNVNISSINQAFGNTFIRTFLVQLSNPLDRKKDYKVKYYYASPKLDGLRGFYVYNVHPDMPIHIKRGLYTREGHKIIGFSEIEQECEKIAERLKVDFLDGEVYSHELDFEYIQSIIMSNKNFTEEEKKLLSYNMFACNNYTPMNTADMIAMLETVETSTYITPVKYEKISSDFESIKRQHDIYFELGYEGIMLRHPEISYEFKRSNMLMKFKNYYEHDFKIIAVEFGKEGSAIQDTIGRIKVEGNISVDSAGIPCEGESKYVVSWIGSGFTKKRRAYYLELHQKGELVGKTVEIKFQNITTDSIRFGRVKKLKLDRL